MAYKIKFGTSGWRERMDSGFNEENVLRAVQGICEYLKEKSGKGTIIVGYDTRKNGDKFAKLVCDALSENGFETLLTDAPTPTPATVLSVTKHNAIAGIQITASHNPPEYNGIKFLIASGASPLPEETDKVEALIPEKAERPKPRESHKFSAKKEYISALQKRFNPTNITGLKVVIDTRHGAGDGYLSDILSMNGVNVIEINKGYDSNFGGLSPNPTEPNVHGLKDAVIKNKADFGIANDGDADRFAIVDENGKYYTANESGLILCDYLFEEGEKGTIAKSIQSTAAFDRLAAHAKVKSVEVPVGFKHIAKQLLEGAVFGVEGAAQGVAFGNWILDKDGIAAGVVMCSAIASRKTPLSKLLISVSRKYDYGEFLVIDVPATENTRSILKSLSTSKEGTFSGQKIVGKSMLDGIKLNFADNAWLLIRGSGTEPVIRIYVEASSKEKADKMAEMAKKYLIS